ncbi:MAG: HAD-IA family hydrolase [Candidatus Omnitrophota bacterium]
MNKPKTPAVSLLFFDLDGTLVDSRIDIANAVNFTLRKLGLKEKPIAEIFNFIGAGLENLIKQALGSRSGSVDFDQALEVYKQFYRKHFLDNTKLYPGVKETLEHFKDKTIVMVSNKQKEFIELTLEALDIDHYFAKVIGGDNIGCLKPSSCPLNEALLQFSVDKNRAIIVGDMDLDILAGKKAGIATCGATYGIGKKEDILKAQPDYIIERIEQLKEIIQ